MNEMTNRSPGLTFDQFVAYKDRCANYSEKLEPDHYFYGFNLKAHNIHAEQQEVMIEK